MKTVAVVIMLSFLAFAESHAEKPAPAVPKISDEILWRYWKAMAVGLDAQAQLATADVERKRAEETLRSSCEPNYVLGWKGIDPICLDKPKKPAETKRAN